MHHLVGSGIRGRGQPALSRALDRWHPKHDVGWAGFRFWFSVERSRLLLGWHSCRRVGGSILVAASSTRKYELAMTQFVFGSPFTNPATALSADRFLCHELSDSPEWHRTELTVRKPK